MFSGMVKNTEAVNITTYRIVMGYSAGVIPLNQHIAQGVKDDDEEPERGKIMSGENACRMGCRCVHGFETFCHSLAGP